MSTTNLYHDCERDGCYRSEIWDWTPYNDCFGDSGIRIGDIDGIVERGGHFLVIDGKRPLHDGSRYIKRGQSRMYLAMAKTGFITVLVVHGQPPAAPEYLRMWLPGGEFVPEARVDLEGVRRVIADWFRSVDRTAA